MAKITKDQWLLIERRHLVDGESINSLAKEYGVNESSIRRKLYPKNAESKKVANSLLELANEKFNIEKQSRKNAEKIAELPIQKQLIVTDIYQQLSNISRLTASVAESEANNAQKLSAVKSVQILNLDPEQPDPTIVAMVKVLGETVNDSLKPALNLLAANKDRIKQQDEQREIEASLIQEIQLVPLVSDETASWTPSKADSSIYR